MNLPSLNSNLWHACFNGMIQEARDAIRQGADVNFVLDAEIDFPDLISRGSTPLIVASVFSHSDCVSLLLSSGVHVNMTDEGGYTALMAACRYGSVECCELLLQHNADMSLRNEDGCTALMLAAKHRSPRCAALLTSQTSSISLAERREEVWQALKMAAGYRAAEVCRAILRNAPNAQLHTPQQGWSPLMMAACYGYSDCLRALLAHPTHINYSSNGYTALKLASDCGSAECCRLLLLHNANPNTEPKSCLVIAAAKNHDACVRVFLEQENVNVNACDENGFTALMYAARSGAEHSCTALLQRLDVGIYTRSADGSTALMLAMRYNHAAVCDVLMRRYVEDAELPRAGHVLMMGCAAGCADSCAVLLRHGVPTNTVNASGCSGLHVAALNGQFSVIKLLLDHGGDTSLLDKDGKTAVEYACSDEIARVITQHENWLRRHYFMELVFGGNFLSMNIVNSISTVQPIQENQMGEGVSSAVRRGLSSVDIVREITAYV